MNTKFPIETESPSGDLFSVDLRRAGMIDNDLNLLGLVGWIWHRVWFRGAYFVTVTRRMKNAEYRRLQIDAFHWRSAAPGSRSDAEDEARSAAAAIAAGRWPEQAANYVQRM